MAAGLAPQALIRDAKRITIKIGSSLLVGAHGLRREWLDTLSNDLAGLVQDGRELVLVSSGAVALGRSKLGLAKSPRLDRKQAAAAVGQPMLMQCWSDAFARHDLAVAQLLLTFGDTESRRRWLNARATIETLLRQGALPVINENDSVATEELRYGDNDRLSARVAQMVQSDLLILLSDVDGLYTADPRVDRAAEHVGFVDELTPELFAAAGPPSLLGSGGMRTKLEAARIAASAGCATLIASGQHDHPIAALLSGERGATVIAARGSAATAYKQWIAGALAPAGTLEVDAGAMEALRNGRSLLAAGVTRVQGEFGRGECVSVISAAAGEIARGLIGYAAHEARAIAGARASDIPARLGYTRGDAMIHRNDLALL